MNSYTKKSVKFSSITLIIGVIIVVIAASLGGKFVNIQNQNVISISETYSQVESLDLDLGFSEVQIKTGNEFKIEASNVSNNSFKTYVENNVWHVEDKNNTRFFNIGNCNPVVTIYLPETFNSKDLNINIGAGELTAGVLNADTTDINVGAGNLVINNLTTNKVKINCGVGNVEINGKVINEGNIKCGIGNVGLDLKGNEKDYNYNLSVGIGEVVLNDSSFAGVGNKVIDNTSESKEFKIDCGIGKVSLDINE